MVLVPAQSPRLPVKSKVLTPISLIRRLPPPTKKVMMVQKSWRSPVEVKVVSPIIHQGFSTIQHLVGLGISEPTIKTVQKKTATQKKRRRVNPGELPPDLNDALKFLQLIFLLLQSHHQVFWNHLRICRFVKNPFFPSHPFFCAPVPKKQQDNNRGGGELLYLELFFKFFTHFTNSVWDLQFTI